MNNYILLAVAGLLAFGAGCQTSVPSIQPTGMDGVETVTTTQPQTGNSTSSGQVVGGDRDEHGCIGSAGYSWCESKTKCLRIWEETCLSPAFSPATTTVLVSSKDPLKYCNGDQMDSEGFAKTITVEKEVALPATDRTDGERIKSILKAATPEICSNFLEGDIKVEGDKVTMPPFQGWAGVSIANCYCAPLFKANLLRLPGIKEIE